MTPHLPTPGITSLFPTPDSLFPTPDSLFPIPYSLFPIPYSLFPTPDSLFPTPKQFPELLSRRQTQLIFYGSHQSQQQLIFVN
ncbi:MAG: hypothetical protein F6J90_29565 [Moorea sp. SIOASIH]|uniref:hypothetical protein n=1 Tax=Moorena sp. SIOASIH TaxID=2607817 RepID=UPI0013BD3CD2|nr:hypothetical protein [Moorena sp. SIOASIH]NEO40270.1 hypothetical protein [Moorena sp. SIOASIH]